MAAVIRAGAVAEPRVEVTLMSSPALDARCAAPAAGGSRRRPGRGAVERRDATGLGAGLVVREHPAGHQPDRRVARAGRRPGRRRDGTIRARPSGWGSRRANSRGVRGPRRGRPVQGLAGVEPVVGDARVVGATAGAGAGQLVEHRRRLGRPVTGLPSSAARSAKTSSSLRTSPGGSTARRRRRTRPSRPVMVPSSSAHWVTGRM